MTSLCRNKTPGLSDPMKNAATEKVIIVSQLDNTSRVHTRFCLRPAFHLYAMHFTAMETELNGMDIKEEMVQDQNQSLIFQKHSYTRAKGEETYPQNSDF